MAERQAPYSYPVYNKPNFGDPDPAYYSVLYLWERSRAILGGEKSAKEYDTRLDRSLFSKNLLLPFSPQMQLDQYVFYKSEAELPNLVPQYARMLLEGVLRKPPSVTLPESVPEEALDWIRFKFTVDNRSLYAFLHDVVWEEISTGSGWISVDFPSVDEDDVPDSLRDSIKPYPVLWKAEQVINKVIYPHPITRVPTLVRIQVRYVDWDFDSETKHLTPVHALVDHHLNSEGHYEVDYYRKEDNSERIEYRNGEVVYPEEGISSEDWKSAKTGTVVPLTRGQPLTFIPFFPLNGSPDYQEPLLQPLLDREIALYNKVSRRNHLLLGAGTYTPYISADIEEESFTELVNAGLGSWLKIPRDATLGILSPPTQALSDYNSAIESTLSEMSRMGMRMLSFEGGNQSGAALEIRNASQTARMGFLNTTISTTIKEVIRTMLFWKYGWESQGTDDSVDFQLSQDFNPTPIGAEWMRLVTEWYSSKLIPRSTFLDMAKKHDLLPSEYDDVSAQEEIQSDALVPGQERSLPSEEDLSEDLDNV